MDVMSRGRLMSAPAGSHDETAANPAIRRAAAVSAVVILEGPDTRLVTAYATRAEAILALEGEVDRLQAAGATIEGDLSSGYVARWQEHGQPVSMRLTLSDAQRQPGKTIRQLREAWGWSQSVLAGRVGVSLTTVSAWERGLKVPLPRHQQRLAELFGVSVEAIAFGPAEHEAEDRP